MKFSANFHKLIVLFLLGCFSIIFYAPPQLKGQSNDIESLRPTIATVRKAKKEQGLNGYIFQDRNSKKFFLDDGDGNTYKFERGQWVKIGGQEQPVKGADKVQVQAKEADLSPPTIATVRKAKKEQGLNGFIFQDRNSKKFFLEDSEGTTYKFEGGQWVKIGGQESPVKTEDKVQAPETSPETTKETETSAPTIDTVRKAKKAQGLNGMIFQDRNSGKWFLEDRDDNTYKFEGGQWKKIN